MAAAIKMDELLVSWLGSDNVYENVLKIIEQQRSITSNNNNNTSSLPDNNGTTKTPPDSPSRLKKDKDEEEKEGSGTGDDNISDASPNSVIPPFYRPAKTTASSSDTDKEGAPPLPRPPPIGRRTYSFSDDQSWDGIYSASTTDSNNAASSATSKNSSADDAKNSDDNKEDDNDDNTNTPKLCIKEQAKSIFIELGKDPPSSSNEEEEEEDVPDDEKKEINPKRTLTSENFVRITKDVCNFPTFFNGPLYKRILLLWNTTTMEEESVITFEMFKWYWQSEMEIYDMSERFFRLLKQPECDFVGRDDFLPYIKELLSDHPGLEFLSNHAEFQEKYAVTVITRIFYTVNKCHSGRITSRQIRRSDLLSAFQQVDEEEDINKVTRYFSYEHFYVLYCRFWELDHDRDYRITREDLLKYGDHSLSHMIVDRIFDAAPRPFEGTSSIEVGGGENGETNNEGETKEDASSTNNDTSQKQQNNNNKNTAVNRDYLSYEDFIFFMLSEEDKANEISVRYWFTCIDVDGDGKLNNMEMRSFYAVQLHRMQCMGHEIVPFEDMLCQMIDMIKPGNNDYLVVEDFLQTECAQVSGSLFDALFNLNKYLQFEQRDPFVERQKREDEFETDWDRFACIDYNRLAMEEEAREEEAMEIDWVTVDDDEDDGDDFNSLGLGGASEAPF